MTYNHFFLCQLIYKITEAGKTIYRSANFNIDTTSVAQAYQEALIQASALLLKHPELTECNFVGIALLEYANGIQDSKPQIAKVVEQPSYKIKEQHIKNYQAAIIENLGYCA